MINENYIIDDLTRRGTTPLDHYVVLDGEMHEWKPSVGVLIKVVFRDIVTHMHAKKILISKKQECHSIEMLHEYALSKSWTNWKKPNITKA